MEGKVFEDSMAAIEVVRHSRGIRVILRGRIQAYVCPHLRCLLKRLILNHRHIEIDLTDCQYGVIAIWGEMLRTVETGKDKIFLSLHNPNPQIRQILALSGVGKAIPLSFGKKSEAPPSPANKSRST